MTEDGVAGLIILGIMLTAQYITVLVLIAIGNDGPIESKEVLFKFLVPWPFYVPVVIIIFIKKIIRNLSKLD